MIENSIFGTKMVVLQRVQDGPLDSEQGAKKPCERLRLRGLYCTVAFF